MGASTYPDADRLLITADSGGSNGSRLRLWKNRACRTGHRDRPLHHRLPPAARHVQLE